MNIIEDLEFRGLLYQATDRDALAKRLEQGPITLYAGFDPTADSLHVGHLLPVITLRRFQLAGHSPVALIGGGTGLIGDPSGKADERSLNSKETVEAWGLLFRAQLAGFFDFGSKSNPARVVNNYEWLGGLDLISFLRDVGKNFTVADMIAKESVKSRLASGISFTEFAYMILQSFDFLKLNRLYNCELQIGGSDQWGNVTAGIDLVRRMEGRQVYGLTIPLLVKDDGSKMGKTESGAVWLDPARTTPYQFFQFWLNTEDKYVVRMLKFFTFLSKGEILGLERDMAACPEKRPAQRALAREMARIVHGEQALEKAEKISAALFYGNVKELSRDEIEDGFRDVPSAELSGVGKTGIVDLLAAAKVSPSRRQAREDAASGAITVNGDKCQDINKTFEKSDRLFGKYLIVRKGRRTYHLVKWVD